MKALSCGAVSDGESYMSTSCLISPSDTAPQLQAFLGVLAQHRSLLEQQREDIEITLAEIAQHETRCRSLLAAARPRTRQPKTGDRP